MAKGVGFGPRRRINGRRRPRVNLADGDTSSFEAEEDADKYEYAYDFFVHK